MVQKNNVFCSLKKRTTSALINDYIYDNFPLY